MVKPRLRRLSTVCLTPSPQEQSPRPASAFDEFSAFNHSESRPVSGAYSTSSSSSQHTMSNKPPTLKDILVDAAPPPWTLSAFMAYLSQNHCMETLEFTLDAQRYGAFYKQLESDHSPSDESNERVCGWWRKLMQTYIVPCAPREVNIPARIRDHLLAVPEGPSPPHPSKLDEAGRIIYELMNDSLLVPFLQSVAPLNGGSGEERARSPRHRSRNSGGRAVGQLSRSATIEADEFTDDSDSNTPPAQEPMTPPTTPPTSEYTFNSSPGGFQRAVAAHSKGWKKVSAKLGLGRKGFGRRSTPSTSSAECDVPVA
ncbi:regulator of G protein signaling domain-containing protein [Hirsutella rhossiliensis]|uniref:Regulator of G protein signaling domain-containing protein n=1 Tax=Hirsutella rhossiliensis TaxID=111463 RepID=A0A9P8SMS8_9HYPO|nr:regulator of G protein signaling domain-containing protein [Hirsutella rhossiliensis]KAH0968326.1 regulator of G protein signaling domain-containing protein [Hirsutella rhossiliensis]